MARQIVTWAGATVSTWTGLALITWEADRPTGRLITISYAGSAAVTTAPAGEGHARVEET